MPSKADRKRPGPKPIYGVAMRRRLVTLDEATIQRLIELGRGNLSAGIRSAASAVSAVSAIETARIVPCIDNL